MSVVAIVVAGGSGERFGRAGGKQMVEAGGHPLVWWAVRACATARSIDRVVVVAPAEEHAAYASVASDAAGAVPVSLAASGPTRQASVASGLAVAADAEIVAVHDGARPLATASLVEESVAALRGDPALDGVVIAHPSVDTVKVVEGGVVIDTPERSVLWAVQTPQTFRAAVLRAAFRAAEAGGFIGTDDASLVERSGGTVAVLEGPRDNIKVTLPEDLAFVEAALAQRSDTE